MFFLNHPLDVVLFPPLGINKKSRAACGIHAGKMQHAQQIFAAVNNGSHGGSVQNQNIPVHVIAAVAAPVYVIVVVRHCAQRGVIKNPQVPQQRVQGRFGSGRGRGGRGSVRRVQGKMCHGFEVQDEMSPINEGGGAFLRLQEAPGHCC